MPTYTLTSAQTAHIHDLISEEKEGLERYGEYDKIPAINALLAVFQQPTAAILQDRFGCCGNRITEAHAATCRENPKINMNHVVELIRQAGHYAYVEYTGGGCMTIYASRTEDPNRPNMPLACVPDEQDPDWPKFEAVAGPGYWSEGDSINWGITSDFSVALDDQGESESHGCTVDDTDESVAAKIIEVMNSHG